MNRKIFAVMLTLALTLAMFASMVQVAHAVRTTLIHSYGFSSLESDPFDGEYDSYGCSVGTHSSYFDSGRQLEPTSARYQTCARSSGTKRAYHYYYPDSGMTTLYASAAFHFDDGIDTLDDINDRIGLIAFYDDEDWGIGSVRIKRFASGLDFCVYSRDGESATKEERAGYSGLSGNGIYQIELKCTIGDSGNVFLWINGSPYVSMDVDNNAGGDDIDEVRWGLPYVINNEGATDLKVDEVCLANYKVGTWIVVLRAERTDESAPVTTWNITSTDPWNYTEPNAQSDNFDFTSREDYLMSWASNTTNFIRPYVSFAEIWDHGGYTIIKTYVTGISNEYGDYFAENRYSPTGSMTFCTGVRSTTSTEISETWTDGELEYLGYVTLDGTSGGGMPWYQAYDDTTHFWIESFEAIKHLTFWHIFDD